MVRWFHRVLKALAVVAPVAVGLPADADNTIPLSVQALRGVRTIGIAFDGVPAEIRRYGVDEAALRAQFEQRLRDAGVNVIAPQAVGETPAAALMEVRFRVHTHAHDYLHYTPYSVSVKLKQKIPLPNAADAFLGETVWSDGRNGLEQPINLDRLNGYVLTILDQFIADLRAQNAS
jgi:hypothetical protein